MDPFDSLDGQVCKGPCKNYLPPYHFNKDSHKPNGLSTWCRTCAAERQRIWRANHPGAKAEHNRRHRLRNPGSNAITHHRRRGDPSVHDLTKEEWWEICAEQDFRCAVCCERCDIADLTMDHIIPRRLEGATTKRNIRALCRSCNPNSGKHT